MKKLQWNQTHKLSLISLFSLWYEREKHPPCVSAQSPPSGPNHSCAAVRFLYVLYTMAMHKACSRNFSLFPLHLATEMWLATAVGGGGWWAGQTRSAHALWLVFFALITGTMLSDFHLSIGTLSLPLFTHTGPRQLLLLNVLLHILLMFLVVLNVLNQLYPRAAKVSKFTVDVFVLRAVYLNTRDWRKQRGGSF